MRLVEIDLSKGDKHEHPDLKEDGTYYLVDWDGQLLIGRFGRQWYGLVFRWFWGATSLQFDAPGSNHSSWRKVWELVDYKPYKETICPICGRPYTSLGYCLYEHKEKEKGLRV